MSSDLMERNSVPGQLVELERSLPGKVADNNQFKVTFGARRR